MPHHFVKPAPDRPKHVHGEFCFHTLTELDAEVAQAVAADIIDRLHKFGWDTDSIRMKFQHENATAPAAQVALPV